MCLAIPARVISIDETNGMATVALGEIEKQISLVLVSDVAIDDYVLVHVGFAINKIDTDEAERTLAMIAEAGLLGAQS